MSKRIGLMGCGIIAYYGHGPAITETPGLELTSIYDPNPDALAKMKERFPQAQAFTDSEAFFQSGIDAITVASPAPSHLNNVEDAARHGKHVLCEKPLAMTEDEIERQIEIMDEAGLMFATAFCYRFSPVALKIKELIEQKAIGEVRSSRLVYIWNCHGRYEWTPDGQRIESPRRVGRMLEGGVMVDCGVHQIDLSRFWIGEVARWHASGAWVEDYEAPDHMWLHMDHETGAHTCVEISYSYTHTAAEPIDHFSYHLIGTDGLIRYDRNGWYFELRNSHGTQYLPGASEKEFHGMYAEWARALETGDPGNLPTGKDGLIATRIARAATTSVIAAHVPMQGKK